MKQSVRVNFQQLCILPNLHNSVKIAISIINTKSMNINHGTNMLPMKRNIYNKINDN